MDAHDNGAQHRPLRLVVADDHEASRAGLRVALETSGFSVAADAAHADSAIRLTLLTQPDQCLIAAHLPGGGIRATAEIHARAPEVAIIVLDTEADETTLFAALDAGAAGYLLKDIEPDALGRVLQAVKRGEAAIPRQLVTDVISEFRARGPASAVPGQDSTSLALLTTRQLDVLEMLSTGASTVEIGRRLAISPTTVRRHLSSIVARLGVDSRHAAADAYRTVRGSPAGRRGLARRGLLGPDSSGRRR